MSNVRTADECLKGQTFAQVIHPGQDRRCPDNPRFRLSPQRTDNIRTLLQQGLHSVIKGIAQLTFHINRANDFLPRFIEDGHDNLGLCAAESGEVTRTRCNISYIDSALLHNSRTR